MSERLNELAELFRQRSEIDKQILALIGEPAEEELEVEEDLEEPLRKKTKRTGKYNKHNPMPEQVKEQIHARHAEGASSRTLVKEFGISYSSVHKILKTKPERMTTKKSEVNSYVCVDGHEFLSKLPPGEVMCPTYHTTDCVLGTLDGPVKADEDN
jgi:hypothetical protein